MKARRPARRIVANLLLGIGLVASIWSIWLIARHGVDTRLIGVRVRSNDPWRVVLVVIVSFVGSWLLRRTKPFSIDTAAWLARLRRLRVLILILVVAALARVWALAFGLPHLGCRPDEEAVAAIAGWLYLGHFDPHSFTYPPLFMLVVAGAMRAIDVAQSLLGRFDIHLGIVSTSATTKFFIARVISAAAGTATVGVVYYAAARLVGRRAGLAAAAFLAFAFLNVRDSHFGVTDVPMTFMLLAAFLWIARLSDSGRTRDLIGAAVLAGLATATKYNAALIVLPAAFAIMTDAAGRSIGARLGRVGLFLSLMVFAFLAIAPFLLVEHEKVAADLRDVARHLATGHGPNLGRGWTYHLSTTLRYGLGLPLLITGLGGLVLLLRKQPRAGILIASFPTLYYVVAGSGYTVFTRHMDPVVPFLCIAAGDAVTEFASWLTTELRRPALVPIVAMVAVGIVISPSAYADFRFDQLLARADSRLLARHWIDAHFPAGTTIAQSGPPMGRAVTWDDPQTPYVALELSANGPRPDLVIVQSSPLDGTDLVRESEQIPASEYDLRLTLDVAARDSANVYDRQDSFYLPMSGFRRIERPGPNFRIYVRRGLIPR
jgi:dolichyl-phosphate-mannose-protein mannosyltransferase